jgi:hypothetical protein
MNAELKMRSIFSRVLVVVALVAPFLYVKSLTNLSITTMSLGQLGYWLVLPGICFLGLSLAAISRSEERFRVLQSGLWGAAIAGFLGMAVPAALLFVASATYSGGGANIGLGLLSLAMPGYLPIVMIIGLIVGEARNVPQKRA